MSPQQSQDTNNIDLVFSMAVAAALPKTNVPEDVKRRLSFDQSAMVRVLNEMFGSSSRVGVDNQKRVIINNHKRVRVDPDIGYWRIFQDSDRLKIAPDAGRVLDSISYSEFGERFLTFATATPSDLLGFEEGASLEHFVGVLQSNGLDLCPAFSAPYIRMAYDDQLAGVLPICMEPVMVEEEPWGREEPTKKFFSFQLFSDDDGSSLELQAVPEYGEYSCKANIPCIFVKKTK